MKQKKQINIYFIDNDNLELDNFRDNFTMKFDYNLFTFNSVEILINKLNADVKEKKIKIVIIDYLIRSRGMDITTAVELLPRIKNIDNDIEVIIFADSDNIELKTTSGNVKPAAYIRKDTQYFARLEAVLHRIISGHEMKRKIKNIKKAIILFVGILVLGTLAFILSVIFKF